VVLKIETLSFVPGTYEYSSVNEKSENYVKEAIRFSGFEREEGMRDAAAVDYED